MFTNMTTQDLQNILGQIEPVELKGLALLRRRQPQLGPRTGAGCWFPADVSPRVLAEAAGQMMDYMQGCGRAMEHIARLRPVPLAPIAGLAAPVEEFPL